MKKIYITFITLAVLGISAGILYLTVVRPGSMELPEDVVMETAFGGEYSFADLPPKIRLIEFMYVNCPDVCPTTSLRMNLLRKKLEEDGIFGDKVEFVTVTIDPRRDTAEKLRYYAERFNITDDKSGWYFLRGTEEDTKKLADTFQFMYRDPGTGNFVHTTFTYMLNENNKLIESFPMGEGFDTDRVYKRIKNEIN
ncbi:SCO family protein [Calidifontibacillus erzurumensis]|uniref:SCO family protein n=1 Tax=Calidifontibacillus erzurumensis TaxID=2741433 RepID=A0A8J8GE63_9BACI|nr:SCO family protein [Calidifontibacillus erzurumensis]NSL52022.1 SCO family protein [Calidifontibacillus erzurumensis]